MPLIKELVRGAELTLFIKLLLVSISYISSCQFAWSESTHWPQSIIVVTSDQRPVSGAESLSVIAPSPSLDVKVLNLDAVTAVERNLSEDLPADSVQAQALVEQRIAEIGRSNLEAEIRKAYLPLATMMSYGLDRYPVIIFDRRAVIFGVTDLPWAISQYRQWLSKAREGTTND